MRCYDFLINFIEAVIPAFAGMTGKLIIKHLISLAFKHFVSIRIDRIELRKYQTSNYYNNSNDVVKHQPLVKQPKRKGSCHYRDEVSKDVCPYSTKLPYAVGV